MDSTTV